MSELELRNQQLHPDSAAHLESSLPAEVMSLKEPQVAQVRPLKPLYLTRPPRHVSSDSEVSVLPRDRVEQPSAPSPELQPPQVLPQTLESEPSCDISTFQHQTGSEVTH